MFEQLLKTHVIYLSFETVQKPANVDVLIPCWDRDPRQISQAVAAALSGANGKHHLLLIDSLHTLALRSTQAKADVDLTRFLMSLLQPPRNAPQAQLSMVAVYHTDIPIRNTSSSSVYSPSPLALLTYLATTIFTVHSLAVLLAEKQARDRSLGAPSFGLAESKPGVVIGLKPLTNTIKSEDRGIVLELEHRRRSGRGVLEWIFLPNAITTKKHTNPPTQAFHEVATLLDDHPLFRRSSESNLPTPGQDLAGMTFELGLTDRQRQEREGVVLPYFDAQKGGNGPGEGGRILYDMGAEDDFDEEEDEI